MIVNKKLRALITLRKNTVDGFRNLEREVAKIESQTRNLSLTVDVAAAVATPVALGAKQIFSTTRSFQQGAIAVAQAEKQVLRSVASRTWGIGATPVGSGVVQGGAQIVASESGFLKPQVKDGLVIAFGKIAAQSFLDMWSPSYWAKRIGGDPSVACQRVRWLNRQNQIKALKQIDQSIAKWKQISNSLSRGIDPSTIA